MAIVGSFHIPVQRYKPKRLPDESNESKPAETITQKSSALTPQSPSAGGEDSPVSTRGRGFGLKDEPGIRGKYKDLFNYNPTSWSTINSPSTSRNPSTVGRGGATDRHGFTCIICNASFPTRLARSLHCTNSHGHPTQGPPPITPRNADPTPAPLIREPCNSDFPTSKALDLYLHDSTTFTLVHHCNLCTLQFPTRGALGVHRIVAHALQFSCNQCDSWFATEKLRVLHVQSVHDAVGAVVDSLEDTVVEELQNTVHRCEICGSEFLDLEGLNLHKESCINAKKVQVQKAVPETRAVRSNNSAGTWSGLFRNLVHRCGKCKSEFRNKKQRDIHFQNCSGPELPSE